MHLVTEQPSTLQPEKACDWFFEIDEQDHVSPEFIEAWGPPDPREQRTILSRSDTVIEVEDVFAKGRTTMHNTIKREAPDRIVIEGKGNTMDVRSVFTFEPREGGCTVREEGRMQPKGMFKLLMPLMGRKFRAMLEEDLELHVKQMEREWREQAW